MGILKTHDLVLEVMEQSGMARNSLEVAQMIVWERQNPVAAAKLRETWLNLGGCGLSNPETIRRTWQKIRATHPEWVDDDTTKAYRKKMEKEFRDYATRVDLPS